MENELRDKLEHKEKKRVKKEVVPQDRDPTKGLGLVYASPSWPLLFKPLLKRISMCCGMQQQASSLATNKVHVYPCLQSEHQGRCILKLQTGSFMGHADLSRVPRGWVAPSAYLPVSSTCPSSSAGRFGSGLPVTGAV